MRTALALPLLLIAGSATAAEEVATDYWVRALPSVWFAQLNGGLSYGTNNSSPTRFAADDVGLGERETTFMIEAGAKVPFLFGVHAGIATFATEGSAVLYSTVTFEDETFSAGTPIVSDLELRDAWVELCIRPLSIDTAGISIGLAAHRFAAEMTISGGGRTAHFDEAPIVPVLALRGHVNLPFVPGLGVEAKLHAISIPLSGSDPRFIEAEIHAAWRPFELLGVTAGYRHQRWSIRLDHPNGSDSSADIDLVLSGPYLGLIAKF